MNKKEKEYLDLRLYLELTIIINGKNIQKMGLLK